MGRVSSHSCSSVDVCIVFSCTSLQVTLPPGAAYILSGSAQGRTSHCREHRVAHQVRCHNGEYIREFW